jgi:serine protease inhibitor
MSIILLFYFINIILSREQEGPRPLLSDSIERITQRHNKFAFKLYNKLSNGKDENFFVSPYSIVAALSMCFAGARGNTEKQLKDVLHYLDLNNEDVHCANEALQSHLNGLSGHVVLNIANKLYPHQNYHIKKEFLKLISANYKSEIEVVDYLNAKQASQTINKWVEEQTKNKIKDLIAEKDIDDLTRLILVNAIYFKGNWLTKFDSQKTTKKPFKLQDGSTKDVDMMILLNKEFPLLISPLGIKAMVCEFPYQGESLAMSVILPHEGVNISEIEAQLNQETLSQILLENTFKKEVHVYLPKFKFEKSIELNEVLKELGANDAFDKDKANFKGMTDDRSGLYLSKVVHKAVIEVNEEGTEAAAATADGMVLACYIPPEEFKCDRPFIFVVHDKRYNTILFMGKYAKP